jgi:hypothetical protein
MVAKFINLKIGLSNLISSIEHNYITIIFGMYISSQQTFGIHVIFQLSIMDDITFRKLEILSKIFLFPKATSRLIAIRVKFPISMDFHTSPTNFTFVLSYKLTNFPHGHLQIFY